MTVLGRPGQDVKAQMAPDTTLSFLDSVSDKYQAFQALAQASQATLILGQFPGFPLTIVSVCPS